MKDCAYFEQLCSNSIDGTITSEERDELSAHLSTCASCRRTMEDLTRLHEMLAEPVDIPESLHESILHTIETSANMTVVQPEKPVRRMPVFTMIAAAAVVVIVVLNGGVGRLFATGSKAESQSAAATAPAQEELNRGAKTAAAPDTASAGGSNAAVYAADASSDAAVESTVTPVLPESVMGLNVASCYLAVGGAQLPEISGEPLASEGGFVYYAVPNNMTVIVEQLDLLEAEGFAVRQYENVGLVFHEKAEQTLLIIQQPQE